MPHETFYGKDVATVLAEARAKLGDDAVVVEIRRIGSTHRGGFELTATDAYSAATRDALARPLPGEMPPVRPLSAAAALAAQGGPLTSAFAARLAGTAPAGLPVTPHSPSRAYSAARLAAPGIDPAQALAAVARAHQVPHGAPVDAATLTHATQAAARTLTPDAATALLPSAVLAAARAAGRPALFAFVGPTGAGKTTTIAKLANHAEVFGTRPVGLLSLDTYRIGAIEQTRIYGDLSKLPVEIVYETRQIAGALKRLRQCEVILIDTAGRGPRGHADAAETRAQLRELRPDEVHLALPSGLRESQARRVLEAHVPYGVTHLLASKHDEDPADTLAFDLATEYGVPMRWIADGQDVPADLRSAVPALDAARTRAVETVLAGAR